MNYNNDFRYDLEIGKVGEKLLGEILEGKKVEVKNDLQALDTGNVFVEYESRGKASGISVSESDWYAFVLSGSNIRIIKTEALKVICRKYLRTKRATVGGDSSTSQDILLPISDL